MSWTDLKTKAWILDVWCEGKTEKVDVKVCGLNIPKMLYFTGMEKAAAGACYQMFKCEVLILNFQMEREVVIGESALQRKKDLIRLKYFSNITQMEDILETSYIHFN